MRFRTILAALAAPALIAGAMLTATAGPALASDTANGAGIFANNFQCNVASNLATQTGFVNFHQDGGTVTAIVHLKDAPPNNTINVWGYSGFCTFVAFLGTVTTNSNGVGNATFSYASPAGAQVFVIGYDIAPYTGYVFDSAAVTP